MIHIVVYFQQDTLSDSIQFQYFIICSEEDGVCVGRESKKWKSLYRMSTLSVNIKHGIVYTD